VYTIVDTFDFIYKIHKKIICTKKHELVKLLYFSCVIGLTIYVYLHLAKLWRYNL